jgi:hypothetical protein
MLFDDPASLTPDEILDWLGLCSHGLERTRQEVRAAAPSGVLPPGISATSLVRLKSIRDRRVFRFLPDRVGSFRDFGAHREK